MSDPNTFMKLALNGDILPEEIDEFVTMWHQSQSEDEIHDFLGLTFEEYSLWVSSPSMISLIVSARRNRRPISEAVNDNVEQFNRIAARSDKPENIAVLRRWLENRKKR